jgi:hypothetical protein
MRKSEILVRSFSFLGAKRHSMYGSFKQGRFQRCKTLETWGILIDCVNIDEEVHVSPISCVREAVVEAS